MCEQDPDIFRWGLHHLLGDTSISDYSGTGDTQDSANNILEGEYVRESNFGTDYTSVENDEVIAHALQEEFSQVAVAEASGPPHADEEHLKASVLAQDWFGSLMGNIYSGIRMQMKLLSYCLMKITYVCLLYVVGIHFYRE